MNSQKYGKVDILIKDDYSGGYSSGGSPMPMRGNTRKCKVLYDYTATAEGVFSIKKNEIIDNIEDVILAYDCSLTPAGTKGH